MPIYVKKTKPKKKIRREGQGRPTALTPEVVKKLEDAFAQGFNITHACGLAEISRETYYAYLEKNPSFSDKIEWLRSKPYIKSILGINKLINAEDPTTLRWYAERKGKDEFSLRTETTGKDGEALKHSHEVVVLTQDEYEQAQESLKNKL